MIACTFENGRPARLRHVVLHAVVERQGAVLLVRRAAGLLEAGRWALPGGFLDAGETAAAGVLRELREETGWEGRVVALLRVNSRPDRPREDRQNVALEFVVEPLRQVGRPDAESSAVEWVPLARLAEVAPLAFDHDETMRLFLDYRRGALALPVVA